ncbi:unnamed protein product [Arctia plantaginis]|uniref:Uncharacterized protein n=1 Tax=Arctia plantaginis TaxID=874455 RepID=A0A8S1AQI2_ARCPL|nr:unnamed protein product [Arctia plantaginis]CAB3247283.1 unnamed protein product [Arctia plantaginis]
MDVCYNLNLNSPQTITAVTTSRIQELKSQKVFEAMLSSAAGLAIRASQIAFALLASLGIDGTNYPTQTDLKNDTSYDYIIVGGGSAGSVVATRLAEDKKNKILVLEAGHTPPINALLAGLFVTLPMSYVDYNYTSTFDPYAAGGQGNYTILTAGKMLGGSDSLNHLLHTRGCPDDLDRWAKIVDDDSWKYENFLKYFIKSERVDDEEIVSTFPQYHGTNGPMGLTRETSDKVAPYLASFAEVGHPTVLDLNANKTQGYTQPLYMIADKIRQTPAKSYLGLVKDYSNLHISTETRVAKVLFKDNVAVGVEAIYKGKTYTLHAKKEIILSAGVINTPQVLMLSGVGPKDHLTQMKIDVLADLPVGKNFTDQVATTLVFKTKKYLLPNPLDLIPDPTKVPFPVMVGSVALSKCKKCPDYQVYSLLLPHDTPQLTLACRDTFWYRTDICDSWQKQVVGRDTLYTVLANISPRSRGSVSLRSTDPFDDPEITTGYFTDETDLKNMVKFVKNFIQVGKTSYFQKVKAELVGLDLDECSHKNPGSDEFWECYILNRAISPYHYTGTCAMGSLVDGSLNLLGFKRIRVIDASVIPEPPKGAPNAAVIALAEKGADMIKSESYY